MENQRKWVNFSFFAASALFAFLLFSSLKWISGRFDWETRFSGIDTFNQLGSIGLGFLMFVILVRNSSANTYMNDVVSELSKVTWPTTEDTYKATLIVVVMVLVSGLILGVFDTLWTEVVRIILQGGF